MQSVEAYQKERAKTKLWRKMARCWQLYLLLIPAVVYIFVFNYMPLYGIQIAFKKFSARKGYLGSPWVGFKYFERFFDSPDFWRLIKNTVSLSVYSLIVGFPLPIIMALMLNQCSYGGFKKMVQNVIYAPHFVSMVVLVGMINVMFSVNSGVVNTVIEMLGGQRILFTGQADCFPHMYFYVEGEWLVNLMGQINFEDYESLNFFQRVLQRSGVFEALEEKGCRDGHTVSIYDFEFDYVK